MKKIEVSSYKPTNPEDAEFPSLEHKIAWQIALYFNEPYNAWVRYVKHSYLFAGQIEEVFNWVKSNRNIGYNAKVRILMKKMYPKSSILP